MAEVVALGELLIDFTYVSGDEEGYPTLAAHPGGAPGNFLAAMKAYGHTGAMIGKVGADAFGALLRGTLERAGIDVSGVVADPAVFTTLAFVTLDGRGERTFSFARKPGADVCLTSEEVDWGQIDRCRDFHFGTLSLTRDPARSATRQAVEYARERGKWISFDPNLREPLWGDLEEARREMLWGIGRADLVKISGEEVEFLWGCGPEEGAGRLHEAGVTVAFVTLGSEGCYASLKGGGGRYVPALRDVAPVDATGAGDIFGGAALSRLLGVEKPLDGLTLSDVEEAARFGCGAAGLSTQRYGGMSSVPALEEVLKRY